jgi:general bacterial porin, GBP family
MKKHLIAAAVAAAVAVPAVAQVKVSGVIDTAVGSIDKGGTGDKGSYTGFQNGLFATPGITFAGSEDLGGGLKASFTINKQFTPSTGEASSNKPGSSSSVFGEGTSNQANFDVMRVAVSGGFGEVSLGRQDMVGREAFGLGRFAGNFTRTTKLSTLGDEVGNSVMYTSPAFAGVTVAVGTGLATGANSVNEKTTGYGIRFAQGKFRAGVGYQVADVSATVDAKNVSAAADYDLGMLKVGIIYLTQDADNTTAGKLKSQSFNVAIPLGSGMNIHAGYTAFDNTAAAANNDASAVAVALTKDLSKRTMVYAAYVSLDNEASARFNHRGVVLGASGNGLDPQTFAIGVRHSF